MSIDGDEKHSKAPFSTSRFRSAPSIVGQGWTEDCEDWRGTFSRTSVLIFHISELHYM